jgi:hypothetical protein
MTTEYKLVEGEHFDFMHFLREAVAEGYIPFSSHTATHTGRSNNLWYSIMLVRTPSTNSNPNTHPY